MSTTNRCWPECNLLFVTKYVWFARCYRHSLLLSKFVLMMKDCWFLDDSIIFLKMLSLLQVGLAPSYHPNQCISISLEFDGSREFLREYHFNMMTSSNGNIFTLLAICAGIHRSPVIFPHKGQRRGALMICAWINGWVSNGEAGDLRRQRAHYYVTVMTRVKVKQHIC